jgi:hypothetical protein
MKQLAFATLRIAAGAILVVVGIIGLALPVIPGTLLIAMGLGVLSVDVPPLKRLRIRLADYLRAKREAARKRRDGDAQDRREQEEQR